MKVWEKIKKYAAEENLNLDTYKAVKDWMYVNRVTPCDMEDKFNIVEKKVMNKLCVEYQWDCLSCLERYLESEGLKC